MAKLLCAGHVRNAAAGTVWKMKRRLARADAQVKALLAPYVCVYIVRE